MHEEGQLAVRYGFEQRPDIWRKGLWHGRIVDPHRFQRALNGGVRAQNVPSAVAVRPKISGDFNVKQTCSFIAPAIRGSGSLVRTPEVADQPEANRPHCIEMLWKDRKSTRMNSSPYCATSMPS